MRTSFLERWLPGKRRWWLPAAFVLLTAGLAAVGFLSPEVRQLAETAFDGLKSPQADHDHEDGDHDHAGHDHAKHGDEDEREHEHSHGKKTYDHKHDEASSIKLSKQAGASIGLNVTKVSLQSFQRTTTVPGIVVERPGWSVLEVTAPVTGVVTRIYPMQGEAVEPGQPLFELRLTHEDLLQLQTEFLRNTEELDVIRREVARLEKASLDGVIAGKTLLERKYEQQKQEAALRAQRQALLLHGLSEDQVDRIAASRMLMPNLTIRAPMHEPTGTPQKHPLQVAQLKVALGKHVSVGDILCTLADHGELYIEGQAFEQDMRAINLAATRGAAISAVLGSKSTTDEETIRGLRILYLDDKVDRDSRAFHFYVMLPNRLLREGRTPDGRRLVYWQFKPGQRTQLRIPVEQWDNRIVLPVEAVAQDGAETYVFEANGDHFDRRSVHVEYRDQDWVVIANDGELRVGATIAASAAHQIQLALKNKAGGGADPHAGHNH